MEIKTKYNIGDEVFGIGGGLSVPYTVDELSSKIRRFTVSVYYPRNMTEVFTYYHTDLTDSGGISENNIFYTREEAQAECDKRNKGEG